MYSYPIRFYPPQELSLYCNFFLTNSPMRTANQQNSLKKKSKPTKSKGNLYFYYDHGKGSTEFCFPGLPPHHKQTQQNSRGSQAINHKQSSTASVRTRQSLRLSPAPPVKPAPLSLLSFLHLVSHPNSRRNPIFRIQWLPSSRRTRHKRGSGVRRRMRRRSRRRRWGPCGSSGSPRRITHLIAG